MNNHQITALGADMLRRPARANERYAVEEEAEDEKAGAAVKKKIIKKSLSGRKS